MKKVFLAALAATTIGLAAFTAVTEIPIGASMPMGDYKMKDVSGKTITLNEAKKGSGVLVMFSCNTCPYVIKNQQRTVDISNYALKNGVGVVLVNSNEGQRSGDDSFASMQQYAKSQGYRWYYTVDEKSQLADAFGAKRTPECYLFNKEGKLVYHGAIDDNPAAASGTRAHLKETINEMLGGKEVSVKTSRSVGCSIKRAK